MGAADRHHKVTGRRRVLVPLRAAARVHHSGGDSGIGQWEHAGLVTHAANKIRRLRPLGGYTLHCQFLEAPTMVGDEPPSVLERSAMPPMNTPEE